MIQAEGFGWVGGSLPSPICLACLPVCMSFVCKSVCLPAGEFREGEAGRREGGREEEEEEEEGEGEGGGGGSLALQWIGIPIPIF